MRALTVAGIVDVVAGGVAFYFSLGDQETTFSCRSLAGCAYSFQTDALPLVVMGLGALLALLGILCARGVWLAAWGGAGVAVAAFVGAAYLYEFFGTYFMAVSAVLLGVAVVANILGARARGSISEQQNPMNLPVFG